MKTNLFQEWPQVAATTTAPKNMILLCTLRWILREYSYSLCNLYIAHKYCVESWIFFFFFLALYLFVLKVKLQTNKTWQPCLWGFLWGLWVVSSDAELGNTDFLLARIAFHQDEVFSSYILSVCWSQEEAFASIAKLWKVYMPCFLNSSFMVWPFSLCLWGSLCSPF